MALQFRRYERAQVFAFDFGGSIRAAALACGGDWQDLGTSLANDGAGAVLLQPLARIDEAAERNWAAEWVQAILASEGVTIDPPTKEHLWSALTSLSTAPIAERTLTGLSVLLQSQGLKQALAPYCIGGPFGRLLDAEAHTPLAVGIPLQGLARRQGPGARLSALGGLFGQVGGGAGAKLRRVHVPHRSEEERGGDRCDRPNPYHDPHLTLERPKGSHCT